jgi:hypothetical protein
MSSENPDRFADTLLRYLRSRLSDSELRFAAQPQRMRGGYGPRELSSAYWPRSAIRNSCIYWCSRGRR